MKKAKKANFAVFAAAIPGKYRVICELCKKEQIINADGFTEEFFDDHNLIYHDLFDDDEEENPQKIEKKSAYISVFDVRLKAIMYQDGTVEVECQECSLRGEVEEYNGYLIRKWGTAHLQQVHPKLLTAPVPREEDLEDTYYFSFSMGFVTVLKYSSGIITISHDECYEEDEDDNPFYTYRGEINHREIYHWLFEHVRNDCSARDLTEEQQNNMDEYIASGHLLGEYDDYDPVEEAEGVVGKPTPGGFVYEFSFGSCELKFNEEFPTKIVFACLRCKSAKSTEMTLNNAHIAHFLLKNHKKITGC